VNPDVPEPLEKIILKALSQMPEDRFATAAEFQAAIEEFSGTLPSRATPRELGKYVAELFEDRRKVIKEAIETQLKNPEVISSSDVRKTTGDVPLLWSLAPPNLTASETKSVAGDAPEATAEVVGASGQERRRRMLALGGLAVAAVATIGFALFAKRTPQTVPETSIDSAIADSASAKPTTDQGPGIVQVSINATPAEARIYLDDVALQGNPATNSFPRDGANHTLRIEAPGYEKKTQFVMFNTKSISIDVALDKDAKHPAVVWHPASGHHETAAQQQAQNDPTPTPPPQTTQAAPTASPTMDPHPGHPRGPQLDTATDPWTGKPNGSANKPN
ncbi:MAG: PEGA domain-containing protein, partial [Polyangiaceae bacterium]